MTVTKQQLDSGIAELGESLQNLVKRPMRDFRSLDEDDVPETMGVYLIGDAQSGDTLYVGETTTIREKKHGQPSGLRFRIMRNHLGRQGTDNLIKKLIEFRSTDKQSVVEYLKSKCFCQWIEFDDAHQTKRFEHFAIAVLYPKFNDENASIA